jgi:hypothetical protein
MRQVASNQWEVYSDDVTTGQATYNYITNPPALFTQAQIAVLEAYGITDTNCDQFPSLLNQYEFAYMQFYSPGDIWEAGPSWNSFNPVANLLSQWTTSPTPPGSGLSPDCGQGSNYSQPGNGTITGWMYWEW